MARTAITYRVTVAVPSEKLAPNDDNIREFYADESVDEVGSFTPATLAMIVMNERLGVDEFYGFDYQLEREVI